MLVPILCFTCGLPLSDKEDIYNHLKAEKIKSIDNVESDDIDCVDILEKLDIMNDCCRMHFITAMIFTDYY